MAYLTFKGIEEKLPQHLFIRIHKKKFVSINAIQAISINEVQLKDSTLPLSKSYRDEVIERIDNRLFKR